MSQFAVFIRGSQCHLSEKGSDKLSSPFSSDANYQFEVVKCLHAIDQVDAEQFALDLVMNDPEFLSCITNERDELPLVQVDHIEEIEEVDSLQQTLDEFHFFLPGEEG